MRPCVHSYDEQTAQYRVHAQKQSFFPGVQAIFYLQWEHNKQPISGGVLKNILCLPWVEGARGLNIIINNGNLTRLNFAGRGPLMMVPLLKNFDFQEERKLILRTCCSFFNSLEQIQYWLFCTRYKTFPSRKLCKKIYT